MHWVAPSKKDDVSGSLEQTLWEAADQFRANSGLKSQEYSAPVLGLIFLRFAEVRFAAQRAKLEKSASSSRRGSQIDEPAAYQAEAVLYLTPNARFDHLLALAPGEAVSDEDFKEQLETLNEGLEVLNVLARELENTIAKNVAEILEA